MIFTILFSKYNVAEIPFWMPKEFTCKNVKNQPQHKTASQHYRSPAAQKPAWDRTSHKAKTKDSIELLKKQLIPARSFQNYGSATRSNMATR
ncbi:hypothetical protein [Anaeromassilibacillus sp. SJQ-1]|uniref:hypothetical protein n=1 Tax=Anaeromassilibacillus sp. SJQ-1 TaxID=3375419 RepID=UPI003989E83E